MVDPNRESELEKILSLIRFNQMRVEYLADIANFSCFQKVTCFKDLLAEALIFKNLPKFRQDILCEQYPTRYSKRIYKDEPIQFHWEVQKISTIFSQKKTIFSKKLLS